MNPPKTEQTDEHDERERHHPPRVVRVRAVVAGRGARVGLGQRRVADEDEEVLATHVVGGEDRGQRADRPERRDHRPGVRRARRPSPKSR